MSAPAVYDFSSGRRIVEDLTYRSYRHQRHLYGATASLLKRWFPLADDYERMYQQELAAMPTPPEAA